MLDRGGFAPSLRPGVEKQTEAVAQSSVNRTPVAAKRSALGVFNLALPQNRAPPKAVSPLGVR